MIFFEDEICSGYLKEIETILDERINNYLNDRPLSICPLLLGFDQSRAFPSPVMPAKAGIQEYNVSKDRLQEDSHLIQVLDSKHNSNNVKHSAGRQLLFYRIDQKDDKATVREFELRLGRELFVLGLAYCYGIEVQQDFQVAKKLFEKASRYGNIICWSLLGDLASKIEKNKDLAYKHYQKGAELNCPIAMDSLGYLLCHEQDEKRDNFKAYTYLIKAANLGNSNAFHHLGYMCEQGMIVSDDGERAYYYYEKSAQLGNALGMLKLAELSNDYFKASLYHRLSCLISPSNIKKNIHFSRSFYHVGIASNVYYLFNIELDAIISHFQKDLQSGSSLLINQAVRQLRSFLEICAVIPNVARNLKLLSKMVNNIERYKDISEYKNDVMNCERIKHYEGLYQVIQELDTPLINRMTHYLNNNLNQKEIVFYTSSLLMHCEQYYNRRLTSNEVCDNKLTCFIFSLENSLKSPDISYEIKGRILFLLGLAYFYGLGVESEYTVSMDYLMQSVKIGNNSSSALISEVLLNLRRYKSEDKAFDDKINDVFHFIFFRNGTQWADLTTSILPHSWANPVIYMLGSITHVFILIVLLRSQQEKFKKEVSLRINTNLIKLAPKNPEMMSTMAASREVNEKEYSVATRWFRRAAIAGDLSAVNKLGVRLLNLDEKDLPEELSYNDTQRKEISKKLFACAGSNGDADSLARLAFINENEKPEKAAYYYRLSLLLKPSEIVSNHFIEFAAYFFPNYKKIHISKTDAIGLYHSALALNELKYFHQAISSHPLEVLKTFFKEVQFDSRTIMKQLNNVLSNWIMRQYYQKLPVIHRIRVHLGFNAFKNKNLSNALYFFENINVKFLTKKDKFRLGEVYCDIGEKYPLFWRKAAELGNNDAKRIVAAQGVKYSFSGGFLSK